MSLKIQLAIGLVLTCSSFGSAQQFFDDFSDSALPGWKTWQSTINVDDGSLVVDGIGVPQAILRSPSFADTSVRSRFHLNEGSAIGIAVRSQDGNPINDVHNYFGWIGNFGDQHQAGLIAGSDSDPDPVVLDFDVSEQDVIMQVDVIGQQLDLWVWPANEQIPESPLVSTTDNVLPSGLVYLWVASEDFDLDNPQERGLGTFRWFLADNTHIEHARIEVGGRNQVALDLLPADTVNIEKVTTEASQSGLLQRWYSIRSPGDYSAALATMFDPQFPESAEDPDVPPFHSSYTWWTGNRPQGVAGTSSYPIEIAGQPRKHATGDWSNVDNDNYTVFLTGEILIPESGEYRFVDGIDDFAMLGIDVNRDGFVDELADEIVINDNDWTDLIRQANNGGLPNDELPSIEFTDIAEGGEWFKIEAIAGEQGGGDSGIFFWDYDVNDQDGDGVRIGDAAGFPVAPSGDGRVIAAEDLSGLIIPDSHLRSVGGEVVSGGSIQAQLKNFGYAFELSDDGSFDQLAVDQPSGAVNTVLDLNDASIEIVSLGDVPAGEYPLLLADEIIGEAALLVPEELSHRIDSKRFLTEGVLVVRDVVAADCNLDGETNSDDLACVSTIEERDAVLATLDVLPGDLDLDGEIGFADFLILSSSFGAAPTLYLDGNINLMNGTDFADFVFLSSNFGKGTVEAIPEPSNVGPLCFCFLGIAASSRRRK